MVLEEVFLSRDLYMACIQLALSTEKEEVICLLLGETEEENGKEKAFIYAMKIPQRLDKKKDRVEISVQQLVAAHEYGEELSLKLNKGVKVLGWFHSHPHITVWPSHVDVNTQANYQTMSSSFVGIICSVFSEDKTTKDNQVNVTCFQAENVTDDNGTVHYERKPIPFSVVPNPPISSGINCFKTICDLPNILYQEEEESYKECASGNSDVISRLHNDMLLTKTQLHITDKISIPLLRSLETRERISRQRLIFLEKFGDKLKYKFGGCPDNEEIRLN